VQCVANSCIVCRQLYICDTPFFFFLFLKILDVDRPLDFIQKASFRRTQLLGDANSAFWYIPIPLSSPSDFCPTTNQPHLVSEGQMEKAVPQPCRPCNYRAWPTGYRASTVQGLPCRTGPTVHFRAWPYYCSHDAGVNARSRSPKIVHDRPRKSFLAVKIDNTTWGIASLASH
jgi:hypothetical protein